jgi:FkbM family methyltransferase
MSRRVRLYFRQFRPLQALRLLAAHAAQKLLDPYATVSYSQTGEDRLIESLLGDTQAGFFVDVGAHHPERFSNTLGLYKKGWTGISIDANRELIARHRKLRRRDTAVAAVVSDQPGDITFTEFDEPAIASVSPDHISEYVDVHGHRITRQTKSTSVTLNEILESHSVQARFDLLTIDVEGHDLEVLSSLDLAKYRPYLIVIEMYDFDLESPLSHGVCRHLNHYGYHMVSYAAMNGYFVDGEQADQAKCVRGRVWKRPA